MNHHEKDHIKNKHEMMEYFIENTSEEPVCCSVFGCGKKLSMEEKLCGNKCLHHSKEQKTDITTVISGKY